MDFGDVAPGSARPQPKLSLHPAYPPANSPSESSAEKSPLWTLVDVAEADTSEGYESDGSIIHISRVPSPVAISFASLKHAHLANPHISWPLSLPWFQFQDRYMRDVALHNILAPKYWVNNAERPDETNGTVGLVLSSKDTRKLATAQGIQRVASEFGKLIPENEPDENIRRVEILTGDDPAAAKQHEIQLFVYQLSNNLIDDPDDEYIEYVGKYTKIMTIFEDINLPRAAWKVCFAQILEQPTGRAFVENLFEAAVNTLSLDACEILLEAGAHPDQLINGWDNGKVSRPIQCAVDVPTEDSADFVRLLTRFGARVDLATDDHPETALLRAAEKCNIETVHALVDAGASLTLSDAGHHISHVTPLARCAEADVRALSYEEQEEMDHGSDLRGLATLKYLLPLYDKERDHEFIQTALAIAAGRNRRDMLQPLLDAGATVNGMCLSGYTPLLAAVAANYDGSSIHMVSALLDRSADPDFPFWGQESRGLRPIHLAAAEGEESIVQLLIDSGADVNAYAYFGEEELAELLGVCFDVRQAEPGAFMHGILRCHTPLQFALYRDVEREDKHHRGKGGGTALALIRAGATLVGEEFARAPAMDSAEILDELLRRGADVNEVDWRGRTALQNCLGSRSTGLVKFLLEAGVKLCGGELLGAVRTGQRETVDLLLRHGATRDKGNFSPSLLAAAAESKGWELLRWLIESHGAEYDESVLCTAVCSGIGSETEGDEETLVALLKKRPTDAVGGILEVTALGCAAFWRQRRVMDHLLKVSMSETCIIPLEGDKGSYSLVTAMLDLKLAYQEHAWRKPTAIRCSVLAPAIAGRNWNVIRRILDAGYLPDRWALLAALGLTRMSSVPHHWTSEAIREHALNSLNLILRLTKSMGLVDLNDRAHPRFDNPLQAAARYGRADLVTHLLSLGVDVNAPPSRGIKPESDWHDPLLPRTALQAAVENGDLEIIDILLDAGADVSAPPGTESGATALQLAAGNGYIGIAQKLISLGASVNEAEAVWYGRTALEAAAEGGRLDMVQFLLEAGARMSKTERDHGQEPFYWAIRLARDKGHGTIVTLLQVWGEKFRDGLEGIVGVYES